MLRSRLGNDETIGGRAMLRYNARTMRPLALIVLAFVAVPTFSQSSTAPSGEPAQQESTVRSSAPEIKESDLVRVNAPPPAYPAAAREQGLEGQVWLSLLIDAKGRVRNVTVISGEPALAKAAVAAVKKWRYAPYLRAGVATSVTTTIPLNFLIRHDNPAPPAAGSAGTAAEGPPADAASISRVRVSQGVAAQNLLRSVPPVYPEMAKENGIQGSVVMAVLIGKDGTITSIKPISGPRELSQAAIDAVKHWQYRPYRLHGRPVEVDTTITVNFLLR